MSEKWIPEIMTPLKQDIVKCQRLFGKPVALNFGRKIKSIIFTTDIAIIRNTDAQAVIAVYPLHRIQRLQKALLKQRIFLSFQESAAV